jgi:hypothetical protein
MVAPLTGAGVDAGQRIKAQSVSSAYMTCSVDAHRRGLRREN